MRYLFSTIGLLLFLISSSQEKIETDRPDQTESPYTVPKKYFQAEFGWNRENTDNETLNLVHPTALLKYGLSNKVELRFESNFHTEQVWLNNQKYSSTLFDPVEIGTKISLFEEKRMRPKASVIAHMGLPFLATKATRPDQLVFISRLTFQNSLTEKLALGYNIGVEQEGFSETLSWFYTIAPGLAIGEKWYAYIELFGSIGRNELPDHTMDGGIAYYISKDVKIDLSGGVGLSPESVKNYIALGLSFRLPVGH